MNTCTVEGDKLFVYMDLKHIPTTEFVQTYLREYCQNTSPTIKTIIKGKEFCLVFTPSDYIALADILDKHLTYNLEQARTIITWIDSCVRNQDDATVDWATVYLEILEGANAK